MQGMNEINLRILKDENFGDLLPFIEDNDVTDINWNGEQLWIDDVNRGRYMSDVVLSDGFVGAFAIRISNIANKPFNQYEPKLEAETEELRITVVHNSVSNTGTVISIRKTPSVKRINFKKSIEEGDYCTTEVADFISNCVKAKLNIIICGLPGVGKTELLKYLTNYIQPRDRVITIEDTLELHYSKINPGYDCLEFKVNEKTFTYVDAIKESLRLLPQWILLSEARSKEVRYLLESLSTGAKCLTTLHTDDVRKIPDRIKNMIGDTTAAGDLSDQIAEFLDIAIYINKDIVTDKYGQERIVRYIDQVGVFSNETGSEKCTLLVNNKQLITTELPKSIQEKFRRGGIENPFTYNKMDWGAQMEQVERYIKRKEALENEETSY